MRVLRFFVFTFSVSAVASTAADEADGAGPWYLGAGFALTDLSAGSYGGRSQAGDSTDFDTGLVVTGGYQFTPYIAAELGYVDGGEPTFNSTLDFPCTAPELCVIDVEQNTTALTATVVGMLPFAEVWDVYARGGSAFWDATAQQVFSSPSSNTTRIERVDADGTSLFVGLGVGYSPGPQFRLRLDYSFFDTDDALLGVDRAAGFQLLTLDAYWRF